MLERNRLWLKHKHREEYTECPLCNASIRWVYDGFYWYPCDKEPVYYTRDFNSKICVVKRRELIEGVRLYTPGMDPVKCKLGLLPHVYSCSATGGYGNENHSKNN